MEANMLLNAGYEVDDVKLENRFLRQIYDIYKKTKNEDIVEQYIISNVNKNMENINEFKNRLLNALKTLKINKRDKKELQEIIQESFWTINLQKEIEKSRDLMEKLSKKYNANTKM